MLDNIQPAYSLHTSYMHAALKMCLITYSLHKRTHIHTHAHTHTCSIEDVLDNMLTVGSALGIKSEAQAAVTALQKRVTAATALAAQLAPAKHRKVCGWDGRFVQCLRR